MENVPVPDQVRCVPLTEDLIRISSTSPQDVPLALSVIVPELETSPERVTSPVPRLCHVAPEEIVATIPDPEVDKFDDDTPAPWENTPLVTAKLVAEVFVAPADPSSETELLGDVPVFEIDKVAKLVEVEPPIV